MTKKRRLTMSGCLYVAGALVAVYGAGLSWRQVLVGGLGLLTWQFADETFKAAYTKPLFRRYQFRFGSRVPQRGFQLSDMMEMRGTNDEYELVLLTREQRYSWSETTRGKGLVLLSLPYKFLWSLQRDPWESYRVMKEILTVSGFAYHSDAEVSEAWHYRNEYGSLKWWDV